MGREAEPESPTLKLPLLTNLPTDHSSLTPNHSDNYDFAPTASIPFKWEQVPGTPIPTEMTKLPSPTILELPPRLQVPDSKMTKLPSPNTVLEGPDGGYFGKVTVGEMVRSQRVERRKNVLFGSWGGSGNKEVSGGSFVFPAEFGGEDGGGKRVKRVRRNPSFTNLRDIKSHFWVNMYEGLKQVMPWRSKKLKKQGLRV